mgnify:CR=1 FL=1
MYKKLSVKFLMSAVVSLAAAFVLQNGHASAATITVTPDAVDQTINGNCSLYEAAEAASTNAAVDTCTAGSGADTIDVPDGTYVLDSNTALSLSDGVLNGASQADTIIDANGTGLVFVGSGTITVTVQNLSIIDPYRAIDVSGQDVNITMDNVIIDGGANGPYIQSSANATFTMTNSIIRNLSSASSGDYGLRLDGIATTVLDGVAIYGNNFSGTSFTGTADIRSQDIIASDVVVYDNEIAGGSFFALSGRTVDASGIVVRDNTSTSEGGAVFIVGSYDSGSFEADVTNVAVVRNEVPGGLVAGAFCDTSSASCAVTMSNMTVAENTSLYTAIFLNNRDEHPMTGALQNVTIANNVRAGNTGGPTFSGGLLVVSDDGLGGAPTMTIQNVVLDNNLDETTPRNCVAASDPFFNLVSLGSNVSSDATCNSMFNQPSDLNSTDPLLDDLTEDNGTWVLPLLSGSPAINSGDTIGSILTDQRGTLRPQGSAYDRGAYEVLGASIPDPDPDPTGNGGGSGVNAGSGQAGTTPGVPNTGFLLLTNNPVAVLVLTSACAGAILLLTKRASRKS